MTMLDHSSAVVLVDNIRRLCRSDPTHRRFSFVTDSGVIRSPPWRFWAVHAHAAELWFGIEYCPGGVKIEHILLHDGRLFFVDSPFPDIGYVVMSAAGGFSGSSVDDSQRDQLDKNLQGIFA